MQEFLAVRDHKGAAFGRVGLLRRLERQQLVDLLSDPEQAVRRQSQRINQLASQQALCRERERIIAHSIRDAPRKRHLVVPIDRFRPPCSLFRILVRRTT